MRSQFVTCQQALFHGDLHTGSIMVLPSETKIIDPEFMSVGPMSFDIGALIGNLWLSYATHEVRTLDPQDRARFRHYLETTIRDMWQVFISQLETVSNSYLLSESETVCFDQFAQQLMKDVAGMAGCIILRRVIGTSGVEDIRGIKDSKERAVASTLALNIGRTLLIQRHAIETIDQLIHIATTSMLAELLTS